MESLRGETPESIFPGLINSVKVGNSAQDASALHAKQNYSIRSTRITIYVNTAIGKINYKKEKNIMNLNIQGQNDLLTEEIQNYITDRALYHWYGSPLNYMTSFPLFVVQRMEYTYEPVERDYYDDVVGVLGIDGTYYENLSAYAQDIDEGNPSWEDAKEKQIGAIRVGSTDDYIEALNLDVNQFVERREDWADVALFFSIKRAKEYQQYQKHNLSPKSRIFARGAGYANIGDYEPIIQYLDGLGLLFLDAQEDNSIDEPKALKNLLEAAYWMFEKREEKKDGESLSEEEFSQKEFLSEENMKTLLSQDAFRVWRALDKTKKS